MKASIEARIKSKVFRSEVKRKSFHIVLGTLLLLVYIFLEKLVVIALYNFLLILAIISDIIRLRIYIDYPLKKLAESLSRSYERTYVGAHTFFLAGILLSAIFFEARPFIIGAIIVTYIDPLMSLTGMLWADIKHPYNKEKSLIGTLIGSIVAFLLIFLLFDYVTALYVAILVYILDSLPIPVSDNFIYPFTVAFVVKQI